VAGNKRRLIPIVDRRFQFKYTAIIVTVAAVVSTALGAFLFQSYQEMNDIVATLTSAEIGASLDTEDSKRVFTVVVAFLVAEVVVLGVLGLLVTHRVCGPIFVLHRHMNTILEGSYPQLRPLRQGDEFTAAFESFRDLVAMLKERDVDDEKVLRQVLDVDGVDGSLKEAVQAMIDARHSRVGEAADS
jgi:signal transduction histidine kinase